MYFEHMYNMYHYSTTTRAVTKIILIFFPKFSVDNHRHEEGVAGQKYVYGNGLVNVITC